MNKEAFQKGPFFHLPPPFVRRTTLGGASNVKNDFVIEDEESTKICFITAYMENSYT